MKTVCLYSRDGGDSGCTTWLRRVGFLPVSDDTETGQVWFHPGHPELIVYNANNTMGLHSTGYNLHLELFSLVGHHREIEPVEEDRYIRVGTKRDLVQGPVPDLSINCTDNTSATGLLNLVIQKLE